MNLEDMSTEELISLRQDFDNWCPRNDEEFDVKQYMIKVINNILASRSNDDMV